MIYARFVSPCKSVILNWRQLCHPESLAMSRDMFGWRDQGHEEGYYWFLIGGNQRCCWTAHKCQHCRGQTLLRIYSLGWSPSEFTLGLAMWFCFSPCDITNYDTSRRVKSKCSLGLAVSCCIWNLSHHVKKPGLLPHLAACTWLGCYHCPSQVLVM